LPTRRTAPSPGCAHPQRSPRCPSAALSTRTQAPLHAWPCVESESGRTVLGRLGGGGNLDRNCDGGPVRGNRDGGETFNVVARNRGADYRVDLPRAVRVRLALGVRYLTQSRSNRCAALTSFSGRSHAAKVGQVASAPRNAAIATKAKTEHDSSRPSRPPARRLLGVACGGSGRQPVSWGQEKTAQKRLGSRHRGKQRSSSNRSRYRGPERKKRAALQRREVGQGSHHLRRPFAKMRQREGLQFPKF
jgi:hypothetical protein